MGLALLVVIWLITFVSTYFFAAKTWWLPGASASAPWIDHQFALTLWLMGIVFVAAQTGLGYFAWKYRDRPGAAPVTYSHGNTNLELIWTGLTAILFVGLNLMGSHVWASERFEPAKPGSVQVEATGAQFAWYFRYPGSDGTYAPTQAKDISAEEQNPLGMNMESADAKDDVVSGVMYLPVNRELIPLGLASMDFGDYAAYERQAVTFGGDPHKFEGIWHDAEQLLLYGETATTRADYFLRLGRLAQKTIRVVKSK